MSAICDPDHGLIYVAPHLLRSRCHLTNRENFGRCWPRPCCSFMPPGSGGLLRPKGTEENCFEVMTHRLIHFSGGTAKIIAAPGDVEAAAGSLSAVR